jgi:hypothetical protein
VASFVATSEQGWDGFLIASESVGSSNQPETLEKGKQRQGKHQSSSKATRQLVGHHSTTKSDAITSHTTYASALLFLSLMVQIHWVGGQMFRHLNAGTTTSTSTTSSTTH